MVGRQEKLRSAGGWASVVKGHTQRKLISKKKRFWGTKGQWGGGKINSLLGVESFEKKRKTRMKERDRKTTKSSCDGASLG